MNKNILIVDDEIPIINSLKRSFMLQGYNIFTAENCENAISILTKEEINIMITDIMMPGIGGYELLKKAKYVSPLTIRIVLSGHADETTLLKIQQNNLAKLYMLKPWENNKLISTIEQILHLEELLLQKNLLEVINEIKVLPSPISIYNKFNILIENDASMSEIANLIENDPSIAAKVLKIANSAFYGIKTGSVRMAITYLGLINVKNIILSLTLYNKSSNVYNNKYLSNDIDILWKHSMITNKILNFLHSRILNKKIPENSAMAGLLHDLGKFVLINNFSDEYLKATKKFRDNHNVYDFFENSKFMNISHEEIGAYFLNWWDLPQPIVECALYHHNPLDENIINKELVMLLYIANELSWSIISDNKYNKIINQNILNKFNLTEENYCSILYEIKNYIEL